MRLLDTDLIIERCLELGLSPIDLARELGVSTVAIRSLEQGKNHDKLTLRRVRLLAETLGVPIAALLSREYQSSDRTASIELRAEAALALMSRRIYPHDYATAVGCTPEQAHTAFTRLRERRDGSGITVTYSGGQWGIGANRSLLTDGEVQALERATMKRTRINVSEAALLKKIIDRTNGLRPDELTHAQQPMLARFLRLGWAIKRNSRYFATDEVRFGLGPVPRQEPTRPRPGGRQRSRAAVRPDRSEPSDRSTHAKRAAR